MILSYIFQFFLQCEMFQTKVTEGIKTYTVWPLCNETEVIQ